MRTLPTGASSRLGAEMARQFAARGHDLALAARRVDRLEQLREEILGASMSAVAIPVDGRNNQACLIPSSGRATLGRWPTSRVSSPT